jgi:hypothetical protein
VLVQDWNHRGYARLNHVLRVTPRFLFVRYPVLGIAVVLVVAWEGWRTLLAFYDPVTPDQRGDLLRTVAQIAGGAILLLGLYWTARNSHITREGQITDRFTRATEQLSSDKLALRLGGIYALERIARDSARDQPAVMDLLTAFVREESLWPPCDPEDQYITVSGSGDTLMTTPRLRADIQAALSVIGRREHGDGREPHPLDLSNADLRRYDLNHADLRGVSLVGTHLEQAGLTDANLSGANLLAAKLIGATVWGADFTGAFLSEADFSFAQPLSAEQIASAYWSRTTVLPPEVQAQIGDPPPELWERSADDQGDRERA